VFSEQVAEEQRLLPPGIGTTSVPHLDGVAFLKKDTDVAISVLTGNSGAVPTLFMGKTEFLSVMPKDLINWLEQHPAILPTGEEWNLAAKGFQHTRIKGFVGASREEAKAKFLEVVTLFNKEAFRLFIKEGQTLIFLNRPGYEGVIHAAACMTPSGYFFPEESNRALTRYLVLPQ
jgi:hypothetical protein